MSTAKLLEDLQQWYRAQCDEEWEHSYGVEIGTLDNPGWSLTIDLTETILEQKSFGGVRYGCDAKDEDSPDWIDCKVERSQFVGAGGPSKLSELIQVFLDWAKTEEDWLALPPRLTAEEIDLGWYKNLGEEIGPEECRKKGCSALHISRSVFCRRHHFEQVTGRMPEE